jgi:hypothetical protein
MSSKLLISKLVFAIHLSATVSLGLKVTGAGIDYSVTNFAQFFRLLMAVPGSGFVMPSLRNTPPTTRQMRMLAFAPVGDVIFFKRLINFPFFDRQRAWDFGNFPVKECNVRISD